MLGKPHPEQDRVRGRSGASRTRMARPFPRVGRTSPRATGGPDEWLLPPLPGRGDRIRLTDLLRRAARPPRPEPARAQKTPAKSYLDSAPSAGVHRALLWGEVGYCGGA